VATFQASGSKALKAAALIAVAVARLAGIAPAVVAAVSEDSEEIALVARDLAGAIASAAVVALLVEAALADLAEGAGADGRNYGLEFTHDFSYNQKPNKPTQRRTYEEAIHIN
jgi:hypothetical protein